MLTNAHSDLVASGLGPAVHGARRRMLMEVVGGPILLIGNGPVVRNLPMNTYRFRQDSTFLYFTGCAEPGAALLLQEGQETLFLTAAPPNDDLWHGARADVAARGRALGFQRVLPISELEAHCPVGAATLAVSDPRACALAARITGRELEFSCQHGDPTLVDQVIRMRRRLDEADVARHRAVASVTEAAHRAAMAATRPGRTEAQIGALFDAVIASAGLETAYESIVTVRGEVLHNHDRVNTLAGGELFLLDGGAEARSGHATDVTRVWPVSGQFSGRQRAAYDAVLSSQMEAIAACRPGVRYRRIHELASRVLCRFLLDEGLLRGDLDGLVERGAHALFFPHGLGHLLGLDVHDLENFGDLPAYAPGRARSAQFGTGYLRLDLDLEPGMFLTIEPGFYVVPAILHNPELGSRFAGDLNRERAMDWVGFGGIRIEDNVLITEGSPDVLTAGIPKSPDEVASLVGTLESLPF
jgi:Xaa-Pro aminopeptidase